MLKSITTRPDLPHPAVVLSALSLLKCDKSNKLVGFTSVHSIVVVRNLFSCRRDFQKM